MNKPSSKVTKKTPESTLPKQRSPLTDLNRTGATGCFRFLKPTSHHSQSTSNSKYSSISNSSTNSSSLFRPKPTRPAAAKSAPPKNPPNRLKQKKASKPVEPQHSILIITPQRDKKREDRSGSTPPIQSSISPEIPCGSSVAPTPVCFAAGYVVTGVVDRRKCRPRGILNIGNGSEVSFDATDKTRVRVSTSSPILPPLNAGASIQWLSSPSEITNEEDYSEPRTCSTKCQAEASVDWFLSPHEKSGNATSSRFSPVQLESPFEKTPTLESNPKPVVHRTPSSDSSISPFSVILKRVSESSAMRLSISDQQIVDVAASSAGIFESMSLTMCKGSSSGSYNLPPPGGSFQFRNDFTPLNSVDLSGFANPKRGTPESDTRISWRDGLVSRIFEMGEKDCCIWLSDCEDDGLQVEDPFEINSKISRDHDAKCGFPSIVMQAESISVEGEDELVSPDESDWRLFYKNHLFEL